MAAKLCLAGAAIGMLQADVIAPPPFFLRRVRLSAFILNVLWKARIRWAWQLWVLMLGSAATSYADDDRSRGPANESASGVDERVRARQPRLVRIPNVTRSRSEPGRPNYNVIGRSLGLSEEIASLLEDFSAVDDGRSRKKAHNVLATHFLSKTVEQVPLLLGVREHSPKGVKFNVDIDDDGVAIEIKVPLPALVW